MKVFGAPPGEAVLAFLASLALALLFFYPAISGEIIGKEDIKFFIWLFWHYGESLEAGSNPFYASEIFYPYGISLASTTVSPLLGALALALGSDGWFRITAIQVLSFALGGLFSFLLMRKLSGSTLAALAGTIIYNFSIFHFEKAVHHLNYSMGMAFVPMFFLFYYDRKRNLPLLSVSLLLIALSESVLAVMTLFVVFLDIVRKYFEHSRRPLFSLRNTVIFSAGLILSLLLSEGLSFSGLPPVLAYTMPSLPFICAVMLALGPDNALQAERKLGIVKDVAAASIPMGVYFLVLLLQPGYAGETDHIVWNIAAYSVPMENLVVPSDFSLIGSLIGGTPAYSESGVYVGIVAILFIAGAALSAAIGPEERKHLEFALLMLLFSFPILNIAGLFIPGPFIAQPLFPLLLFLRVSSRFMVFSLLFMAIGISMISRRLLGGKTLIMAAFLLLLVAERLPDPGSFLLEAKAPEFYLGLGSGDAPIFIYPRTGYHLLLDEIYFQSMHGKSISYGILSRAPLRGNDLIDLYSGNATVDEVAAFARKNGFRYVVLQKKTCRNPIACFNEKYEDYPENETDAIKSALVGEFGPEMYEDGTMASYQVR